MQWFKREARDQRDNSFWFKFVCAGIIGSGIVYGSLYGSGWAMAAIAAAAR
jgi:hypothetical protein